MTKATYRKNQIVTETAVHEENLNGEGMGAIIDGDKVCIYSHYGVENVDKADTLAIIEAMERAEISKHLIIELTGKR